MDKPEDAAEIIKECEEILRTKTKGIKSVAYYQGKIFKRFKEKDKFMQMVSKLNIYKSNIIFKTNIFQVD